MWLINGVLSLPEFSIANNHIMPCLFRMWNLNPLTCHDGRIHLEEYNNWVILFDF